MDRLNTFLLHTYRAAQRRHPDILYLGLGTGQRITLTFDDGPHPRDTPRLLEVLERHRVRATFHLVGKSVERHPDMVNHIHQCGHQLAPHCYRHMPFPLQDSKTLRAELGHSQNIIASAVPGEVRVIYFFAPTFGPPAPQYQVRLLEAGVTYQAYFWDPRSGREHDLGAVAPDVNGNWTIPVQPELKDWVVVLERQDKE